MGDGPFFNTLKPCSTTSCWAVLQPPSHRRDKCPMNQAFAVEETRKRREREGAARGLGSCLGESAKIFEFGDFDRRTDEFASQQTAQLRFQMDGASCLYGRFPPRSALLLLRSWLYALAKSLSQGPSSPSLSSMGPPHVDAPLCLLGVLRLLSHEKKKKKHDRGCVIQIITWMGFIVSSVCPSNIVLPCGPAGSKFKILYIYDSAVY